VALDSQLLTYQRINEEEAGK